MKREHPEDKDKKREYGNSGTDNAGENSPDQKVRRTYSVTRPHGNANIAQNPNPYPQGQQGYRQPQHQGYSAYYMQPPYQIPYFQHPPTQTTNENIPVKEKKSPDLKLTESHKILIQDALKASELICKYLNMSDFVANDDLQDAIKWQLITIGESLNLSAEYHQPIPPEKAKKDFFQIPWGKVNKIRNKLIYQYNIRLDPYVLKKSRWDFEKLSEQLRFILKQEFGGTYKNACIKQEYSPEDLYFDSSNVITTTSHGKIIYIFPMDKFFASDLWRSFSTNQANNIRINEKESTLISGMVIIRRLENDLQSKPDDIVKAQALFYWYSIVGTIIRDLQKNTSQIYSDFIRNKIVDSTFGNSFKGNRGTILHNAGPQPSAKQAIQIAIPIENILKNKDYQTCQLSTINNVKNCLINQYPHYQFLIDISNILGGHNKTQEFDFTLRECFALIKNGNEYEKIFAFLHYQNKLAGYKEEKWYRLFLKNYHLAYVNSNLGNEYKSSFLMLKKVLYVLYDSDANFLKLKIDTSKEYYNIIQERNKKIQELENEIQRETIDFKILKRNLDSVFDEFRTDKQIGRYSDEEFLSILQETKDRLTSVLKNLKDILNEKINFLSNDIKCIIRKSQEITDSIIKEINDINHKMGGFPDKSFPEKAKYIDVSIKSLSLYIETINKNLSENIKDQEKCLKLIDRMIKKESITKKTDKVDEKILDNMLSKVKNDFHDLIGRFIEKRTKILKGLENNILGIEDKINKIVDSENIKGLDIDQTLKSIDQVKALIEEYKSHRDCLISLKDSYYLPDDLKIQMEKIDFFDCDKVLISLDSKIHSLGKNLSGISKALLKEIEIIHKKLEDMKQRIQSETQGIMKDFLKKIDTINEIKEAYEKLKISASSEERNPLNELLESAKNLHRELNQLNQISQKTVTQPDKHTSAAKRVGLFNQPRQSSRAGKDADEYKF